MAIVRRRRALGSERGAELVEFAIVLPLLLMVFVAIVDFGFLFQRYVVLTNAAMEGARIAVLPGYTATDAENRVVAYAANGGIPNAVNPVVTPVALPGVGGGTWPGVQVQVTNVYTYTYVGPIMSIFGGSMGPNVTLTARSTMRSHVAPAPGGS
ncbi:MAG: TadE/TadG family type IV pilus assembly protein [Acidobacteriota bacterium]